MLIRIFFISRRLGWSSSVSRVTVVPLQASSKSSSPMFGFFEVFGLFSVEPRSPCLCFLVSGIGLELVKEKCLQFEMIYLDRFLLHEGSLFWRSTLAHEKYVLTPWCTSPMPYATWEKRYKLHDKEKNLHLPFLVNHQNGDQLFSIQAIKVDHWMKILTSMHCFVGLVNCLILCRQKNVSSSHIVWKWVLVKTADYIFANNELKAILCKLK